MPDTARETAARAGFAELICADPDWVRAEFDAMVAANFRTPPPRREPAPRPDSSGHRTSSRGHRDAGRRTPPTIPVPPCPRRERSPPRPASDTGKEAHLKGR
ncbi:hypothetical protein [Amycolatopsis eburnea]|uniref:Uncharacterized protein n=1 Tax=Amycolatopsis eburnea TaxID=2267691 RepID=A0A3R9DIY7_9PSEU|nr:hypothetical protein [Amycolatopsis eburnea]RSD17170.1 hypothetical protein EIY87_20525 [Amycolatopsis eburnea]